MGSTRVLLVDDNLDDIALAAVILTRELEGVEVIRASDEDTLARVLDGDSYDAVVTECRLGWTDGFHVLRDVRSRSQCPVVMFTASGDEEVARRALKGGFADYVGKSSRGYLRLGRRLRDCIEPRHAASRRTKQREFERHDSPSSNDQSAELLRAVSHDLQEPLRGISRFSHLLEEKLPDVDPEVQRYLRHVVEASERMRAMLDDYLEYLKVGKEQGAGENADLEVALNRAIANLRVQIEESGADIRRSRLPVVSAGLNDMVRLFQNLIDNALKFRSTAPLRLEVTAEKRQSLWLLSFRDNGIGIDSSDFERIFQMHRRLHPINEFPGNGMGLAICKRIIEQYGGRIWVDSQVGVGSTFHVTLPPAAEAVVERTDDTG